MNCIEDILEIDLLKDLKYIYNKADDNQTMLLFFLRACIYWRTEKISNEQYISFLIKELNIPNDIIYNGIKISKNPYDNNNLQNIMDSFIFYYLERTHNDPIRGKIIGRELIHIYYTKYLEGIQRRFRNKKSKIKDYKHVSQYCMLLDVYNDFDLSLQPVKRFSHYEYPKYHNDVILSFDECCQIYYNEYIKNKENILEKDLEDYICRNNFKDIRITNRQLKVQSGIIDLFGIDSNDIKVLIELKVNTRPKDLIWQLQAYTDDLKEHYNKLRTIVITPKLDINIQKQIPKEFEIYEFKKNKNSYSFKKVQ